MFKRIIKEEHKVPAEVGYLGEMRDFITRIGRKYGVSERIINAFKLAIDEAGTNIIRHAYRDWEGFITIQMLIRDKTVTVSLIDQGHAFDPNNVGDPDLQRYVEIGKKGGLGIFIIRRVIDEIDYRKTAEGNELRLTKKRDVVTHRRFLIPDVSMTMKTRLSMIASGILSSLVIIAFVWNYFQQGSRILQENFDAGKAVARSMALNSIDYLVPEEEAWELARIAKEVQREYGPLVKEALVIDTTGLILGAYGENLIYEQFRMPEDAKRRNGGVFGYELTDIGMVYDIIQEIIPGGSVVPRGIGTVHLLLDRTVIETEIRTTRQRSLWTFGFILLAGNLGILILIYITISPFKRLSKWVRALGRGEGYESMEFDASDEVGEIAQAFNEITEKFRRSQESLAEQERLQKEMQVAQEIQHTLLPSAFPEIEGYEIASYYEAAKEVGGDYFDFVEVDKDTLGIVVADVSGKGVPGSLVMTMIRTALRTEARGNKNAADVLARVNDFVINDMKRGMFVTIFYIILDSKNRTINYASAGHNPMILYRGRTLKSYYLNPRGFPIGINLPDQTLFRRSIQSDTLRLQPEDVLIVYTDGITEAMNPIRDRYGEERYLSSIRKYGNLKVDPLVDKIKDDISRFTENYPQSDDITLVAIREKLQADEVRFTLRTRLMDLVKKEGISVKEACRTVGVSTSTYYKYKKRFEKQGADGLRDKIVRTEIEEKHISIEDKAKIYNIIKEHPEFGAKRISEELNSEKYGLTVIDDRKIYEELVRCRLNTKQLRLAFVERGGGGKRMKAPGTPFLTLDGQVIVESRASRKPDLHMPPAAPDEPPEEFDEELDAEPSRLHVSQRPAEEIYYDSSKPEDEKSNLLEEFLSLAEDDNLEMELEALTEEGLIDPSVQDEFEPGSDEVSEELEITPDTEQTEEAGFEPDVETVPEALHPEEDREIEASTAMEDEEEDSLGMDEIFDELITDMMETTDEQLKDVPGKEEKASLEKILELPEDLSKHDEEEPIEEGITSSIAGELFGEEMGLEQEEGEEEEEAPHEEGFLEMMEGLGFDRRTVLSPEKSERPLILEKKSVDWQRNLDQGHQWYKEGNYDKAVEEFGKVVEFDPDSVEASQCLGDSFFRMGQLDKAREAYERVRQLDPDNVNVLENLGVIFANQGDYKKAVWQWGEVLKRNPDRRDIITRIKKMQRVIRQRYL